ncbi:MAG: hypothetical protein OEY01_12640 [Desulfobulbaceae bacterium]|nr:hypothetical protein [Desulfobulbaceae bacterium]HIJ79605.1 hypothetical protein [Deltaproteobacteria bacterium]
MVISEEVKFPRPVKIDPYHQEKKVEAIDGVNPVARIGAFKRDWQRRREEDREKKDFFSAVDEKAVRRLVDNVNVHLENQNIAIHLVLIKDEGGGYSLDVYDCTGGDRCSVIHDVVIDLNDLPILLRNLQQETGILLDTVS